MLTDRDLQMVPNHRAGKIKTRVFALLLLMLCCGMLISAFRSMGREFSGTVIRKAAIPGITSTQYHLYLLPSSEATSPEVILKALANPDQPLQRVGVSAVAYAEAQELVTVEKKSYSFIIDIAGSQRIDLGLFWLFLGLAGLCGSFWMYLQTLKPRDNADKYQPEELDIPGLD